MKALIPALAFASVCFSSPSRAHQADVDTVRLTLRDGNVVIRASLDIEAWLLRRAELQQPLVRAELASRALDTMLAQLQEELTTQTLLRVDGTKVAVRLRSFPSRDEVLRLAARNFLDAQRAPHSHRQRSELLIEGAEVVPGAKRVAIAFPASLSEVAVTFVEPQSRWIRGGEVARFESPRSQQSPTWQPPLEGGLLVLVLLGMGVFVLRRRDRRSLFGLAALFIGAVLSVGCSSELNPDPNDAGPQDIGMSQDAGADVVQRYEGEAWADNWFSMSIGDALVIEDSVSITTERSFNAERFSFEATPPFVLSFVLKDYKADDSGLEYIGQPNQQMGDGGFIVQIRDASGALAVVSNGAWRCLTIHTAPLDPSCERSSNPTEDCSFESLPEPDGWKNADFDDSAWESASVYSAAEVQPKDGYDEVRWDASAQLIWGDDLELDNTILCRVHVD